MLIRSFKSQEPAIEDFRHSISCFFSQTKRHWQHKNINAYLKVKCTKSTQWSKITPHTKKTDLIPPKIKKKKKYVDFFLLLSLLPLLVRCNIIMLQYKYKWMNKIKINGFYWCILCECVVCVSVSYVNAGAGVTVPFPFPFPFPSTVYTICTHFFFYSASYFLVWS